MLLVEPVVIVDHSVGVKEILCSVSTKKKWIP